MLNKKYLEFKSFMDKMLAITLLILLIPLILIISIVIYIMDGWPVIFSQKRLGINRLVFIIYKFRTMNHSKLSETDYNCKKGDNRITKIGLILRKYSLDEIPQLINILKGEMSFIGPRPPVHDGLPKEFISKEVERLLTYRFYVKPGISGLAQVYGRNSNTWSEKIKLDYKYIHNLSRSFVFCLKQDLQIFLLTFKEIISSSGQYDI